jgi:hypothetical protein
VGDGSEDPERSTRTRRTTTLVTVGTAVLVAAVIGGVAALGSSLRTVTDSPDGGSTAPGGSLSIIGGSDSEPVGLPPELRFRNLATAPADASARITVTAGNGQSYTMYTTAPERPPGGEGQLVFRGDQSLGDEVVGLGPPPFRYSVELSLDGGTYRGTGSWPEDQGNDDEHAVELAFDPPLSGRSS